MDKGFSFEQLLKAYKLWVINNPNVVTDVETAVTWSSYFLAGSINKSPIISELIFSLSKLLSLVNDKLIKEAYGNVVPNYGIREQIKLWLTIIRYCEVFVELAVRKRWGIRGKWTAAVLIQLFKCCSELVLLYRFKEIPILHPPIPALQRKKFTEGKDIDENSNAYFTLKRSGRIVRRVDGAPPVGLRNWQPIKIQDNKIHSGIEVKDLLHAELLHILKPLIHLGAMRVFGTKAWKQWLIALGLDLASFKLYNRHLKMLSQEQRLEISRRKLSLVLYLLRTPMYDRYSKHVIESSILTILKKMPFTSFILRPIIQHLGHWQDIYFYVWTS